MHVKKEGACAAAAEGGSAGERRTADERAQDVQHVHKAGVLLGAAVHDRHAQDVVLRQALRQHRSGVHEVGVK